MKNMFTVIEEYLRVSDSSLMRMFLENIKSLDKSSITYVTTDTSVANLPTPIYTPFSEILSFAKWTTQTTSVSTANLRACDTWPVMGHSDFQIWSVCLVRCVNC